MAAHLSKQPGGFDIIIDDGSHASYHQQLTMVSLFALLRSGGLYIIEDLNWQPTEYEATLPKVPLTSRLLERFIETGKFADTGGISTAKWQALSPQMGSVLLFDEDYFYNLRLGHNSRLGHKVTQPSHLEMRWPDRLVQRRYLRHLFEHSSRMAQMLTSGVSNICSGRIALAVINKL